MGVVRRQVDLESDDEQHGRDHDEDGRDDPERRPQRLPAPARQLPPVLGDARRLRRRHLVVVGHAEVKAASVMRVVMECHSSPTSLPGTPAQQCRPMLVAASPASPTVTSPGKKRGRCSPVRRQQLVRQVGRQRVLPDERVGQQRATTSSRLPEHAAFTASRSYALACCTRPSISEGRGPLGQWVCAARRRRRRSSPPPRRPAARAPRRRCACRPPGRRRSPRATRPSGAPPPASSTHRPGTTRPPVSTRGSGSRYSSRSFASSSATTSARERWPGRRLLRHLGIVCVVVVHVV